MKKLSALIEFSEQDIYQILATANNKKWLIVGPIIEEIRKKNQESDCEYFNSLLSDKHRCGGSDIMTKEDYSRYCLISEED